MGKTTDIDTRRRYFRTDGGEDGAINVNGNTVGCYVHGLFWSDFFQSTWLNQMQKNTTSELIYRDAVVLELEELADQMETQ